MNVKIFQNFWSEFSSMLCAVNYVTYGSVWKIAYHILGNVIWKLPTTPAAAEFYCWNGCMKLTMQHFDAKGCVCVCLECYDNDKYYYIKWKGMIVEMSTFRYNFFFIHFQISLAENYREKEKISNVVCGVVWCFVRS